MKQSKNLAVMFLLGALLVGGALGFAADRMAMQDRMCAPADRRALRDRMADELGLTVAQRATLDTILDERHAKITTLLQPIRPQLDVVKDTARQRIRRMLTAEQQAVFDEMQRQMQSAPK